jgi:hypothetical protein
MFTREDGQALHPEHITKRFARLVRDAGLPPITLHGIRHSYATAALAAGEPLKVVSERLGHASISITANLYQHVLPSMDERTANAVATLILGDRNRTPSPPLSIRCQRDHRSMRRRREVTRELPSSGVSEGGLEPPRPIRALGPQPAPARAGSCRLGLRCALEQAKRRPAGVPRDASCRLMPTRPLDSGRERGGAPRQSALNQSAGGRSSWTPSTPTTSRRCTRRPWTASGTCPRTGRRWRVRTPSAGRCSGEDRPRPAGARDPAPGQGPAGPVADRGVPGPVQPPQG